MNNNGIRGLSKSLLDAVRGVMEAQEGGHPKTAKQKELAAKAPPHDKITHADVLAARGVLKKHPDHGKMVVAKEEADLDEASLSAKDAAAGKDIGKPGKAFSQIAKSAGAKYGSKEAGLKVAGAVLAKMRAKNESVEVDEVEELDELSTDTLKSYRKKARAQGNAIVDKMKMGGGDWSKDQKDTKTLRKRAAGAQASGKQLVKRGESLKTEEAELEENALNAGDLIKKAKSTLNHDHPAMKHVRALEGIKKYGGAFDVAMDHTKQLKKALGEEAEQIDEAMSSGDRYASTHAEVMRLHKSIGDYLATHKKNAMAHKGEFFNNGQKGPHWGHVADIDNVHSELKGMHDLLARQHEYSNPMRESVEDEVVLTDEEIAALNELNASLEDTVEIEEARGRPPKPGSAAHKRRMEAEKRGETEGDEPRQHIIQQLQRAKLSMQGASKVKFKNGEEAEVRGVHAAKLLDKYAGMKPSEKESFQKEIGASHEGLKKHL